jgi:hypothetical protein
VLATDSSWRLAVESDVSDHRALKQMRESNPTFQPYFARTTSADGQAAFAFVVRAGGKFKIFYARMGGKVEFPTQDVATLDWLADGRISLRQDTLDVAPFNSDEIFVFGWNATTGRLELASSGAAQSAQQSSKRK